MADAVPPILFQFRGARKIFSTLNMRVRVPNIVNILVGPNVKLKKNFISRAV